MACDRKGFQLLQRAIRVSRALRENRRIRPSLNMTSEDYRSGPRAPLGWPRFLRLMGIGGLGAINPLGAVVR